MMNGAEAEVIGSYLRSAAEEMRRTLVRTAFNPVIYEVLDFGISIYERNLELIAEAPSLTFFLGANDYAIRKAVDYVGEDSLNEGDILLLNYPYWNSAHTLDVTLFAPVFEDGGNRPFAYTCIRAHWMDLGAKDPGYVLDSTDMHQEGLIFPGTKIYERGVLKKEILELIRFNSRMPDLVIGDLNAQIAATKIGHQRLKQLNGKFGNTCFEEATDSLLNQGEKITRKALENLPHGSWTAEDIIDDDGVSEHPIPIKVQVSIDATAFTVDFSGSSDSVLGPVNIPFGRTQAICKVALKSLTAPHTPSNGGNFRPLQVIAPPGNLFHAVYPSATFTLWSATVSLELLFKALAQAMPGKIAASSGGENPGFMMVGKHPSTRRLYAVSNNDPVGWGASSNGDGCNATNHLSQTLVRNTPVEVLEMKTQMLIEKMELRKDSGGAGKYRGGLGLDRSIRFLSDGEFLSVMKKTKSPPWALEGGRSSAANRMVIFAGTEREKYVGTKRIQVKNGDRVVNQTAGGGGYSEPFERTPGRVLQDVLDGYVSLEEARRVYGVNINNEDVDLAGTQSLRHPAPSDEDI
jgi:N-methylhydantoinase B